MAPDGVEKQMMVVNNQFPGYLSYSISYPAPVSDIRCYRPTIEANWGDWIEVEVHNNLDEGTAFHW
jgi:FtsP/CotA-like multicopper oxidase with cupredoxin domain